MRETLSHTNKPRICFIDLESSYNSGYFFGAYEQDINFTEIIQERHLHCAGYKFSDERTVHVISQLDNRKRWKKNIHDDYHVVSELMKVIEKADIIVAHNLFGFDLPMLQGRILLNGLKPLPEIKGLDTLRIARRHFKLPYNNLNYLAKVFGLGSKTENPKGLWRDCFEGSEKAMRQMSKYNKNDVLLLEGIFKKLMPFVKFPRTKEVQCQNPGCGSFEVQMRGYDVKKTLRRFQCKQCFAWGQQKTAN